MLTENVDKRKKNARETGHIRAMHGCVKKRVRYSTLWLRRQGNKQQNGKKEMHAMIAKQF